LNTIDRVSSNQQEYKTERLYIVTNVLTAFDANNRTKTNIVNLELSTYPGAFIKKTDKTTGRSQTTAGNSLENSVIFESCISFETGLLTEEDDALFRPVLYDFNFFFDKAYALIGGTPNMEHPQAKSMYMSNQFFLPIDKFNLPKVFLEFPQNCLLHVFYYRVCAAGLCVC